MLYINLLRQSSFYHFIYLPEGLPVQRFYQPVARGLEIRIGERLAELRALDDAAKNRR